MKRIAPFGPYILPTGVEPVEINSPAGPLSALVTGMSLREAVGTSARAGAENSEKHRALLVPGFTGSKEDFAPVLPFIERAGYEALAYSQRGQGGSSAPTGLSSYGISDFVGDLIAVAEDWAGEDGRVHLLGHSFGGVVARAAACARPDLFASLTLFCSGRVAHEWMNVLPVLDPVPSGEEGRKEVLRAYFPDLDFSRPSHGWEEFQRVRGLATASENMVGIARILKELRPNTDAVRATHLPFHVLYGDRDELWPASLYREEAHALGARESVIVGGDHCPQMEFPREWAQYATSFWTDVDNGRLVWEL